MLGPWSVDVGYTQIILQTVMVLHYSLPSVKHYGTMGQLNPR